MCFVGVPAPLAGLGMGQIAVADELVERWNGPQLLTAGLRVGTKQRLGKRRAARASCLLDGEDTRRAELELTLPAVSVEIPLVEGLATRRPDFEQEAFLARVEVINFNASYIFNVLIRGRGGAGSLADHEPRKFLGGPHFKKSR